MVTSLKNFWIKILKNLVFGIVFNGLCIFLIFPGHKMVADRRNLLKKRSTGKFILLIYWEDLRKFLDPKTFLQWWSVYNIHSYPCLKNDTKIIHVEKVILNFCWKKKISQKFYLEFCLNQFLLFFADFAVIWAELWTCSIFKVKIDFFQNIREILIKQRMEKLCRKKFQFL